MKKIIMMLIAALCCVSVFANETKVVQGDRTFFKMAQGTAILEFDFEGATYDGKMPLENNENFKDIAYVAEIAWNGFKEDFDNKNKGKITLVTGGTAEYKITVKVTKMDQFFNVMGWIPAPATKMWGTVTVTDMKTGEVILVAAVDGVDGGSNPSPDGTISDCFEELGSQVARLK